jgi:hypothetical protein
LGQCRASQATGNARRLGRPRTPDDRQNSCLRWPSKTFWESTASWANSRSLLGSVKSILNFPYFSTSLLPSR